MMRKIISDLPEREYRAHPSLSVSQIKEFASSETSWHYFKRNLDPHRPKSPHNQNFEVGHLVHSRCQYKTKEEFAKRHVVAPKGIVRGKSTWNEFIEKNKGKTLVRQADWDLTEAMFEAIHSHPRAKLLLREGNHEESFFADYKGIPIKGRTDFRFPGTDSEEAYIVDIKTTKCGSPNEHRSFFGVQSFSKSVYDGCLYWQAAFYCYLAKAVTGKDHNFYFVAVEKEYPHAVSVHKVPTEHIELGEKEVFQKLEELHRRMTTNDWEDYGPAIHTTKAPAYFGKQKLQSLSKKLIKSPLIPEHFRTEENAFLLLDTAKKMGCGVLELANNTFIRNGKLSYSSAFLIARANESGLISGIKYRVTEEPNDVVVTAHTTKQGEQVQSSVRLSTALDQWDNSLYKNKDLAIHVLKLRAASWLIRTQFPEAVSGLTTREEQEDIQHKKII